MTESRGAALRKEIAIPQQAHLEFEISWDKLPQFTLAFCSSIRKEDLGEGFRLEVWDRTLVLIRELKQDADVAIVTELDRRAGRVHLEAFYNFSTGEFSVQSLDGKQLAKVTLPERGEIPLQSVWLINDGAGVRLEQLSVSNWNGQTPSQVDATKPRIHKSDGTILYGDIVGYDPEAKQFVVRAETGELRLDAADMNCAAFTPEEQEISSAFRIGLDDGSRLTGDVAKVETDKLYLQRRGIDQSIVCGLSNLRSLISLKHNRKSPPSTKERIGRLETEDILSHGALVAAPPGSDAQATCFAWRPRDSATGSTLRSSVSGRIVYRETPPVPKNTEAESLLRQQRRPPPRPAGFIGAITSVLGGSAPAIQAPKAGGTGTLCLVTGDRVPCEAVQIDDEGVHFTSSVAASHIVPHQAAKALEFVPNWTAARSQRKSDCGC